jgi:hypothetical protein
MMMIGGKGSSYARVASSCRWDCLWRGGGDSSDVDCICCWILLLLVLVPLVPVKAYIVWDFGKDDAVISCVRSGLCRLYLLVGRSFVSIMFITLWRRLFCVKRFLSVSTKNMDPSFQRDSRCPLCDELVHYIKIRKVVPVPLIALCSVFCELPYGLLLLQLMIGGLECEVWATSTDVPVKAWCKIF